MTADLFDFDSSSSSGHDCEPCPRPLGPGSLFLPGFALSEADALLAEIQDITAQAPFRCMTTPGGFRMSAAMTNCGPLGWVTDKKGYRYSGTDPESGRPWPVMPDIFRRLAERAAAKVGFDGFQPDACLINRYAAGTRLSLHQDRDEADFSAPIVSVSLGVTATFLWGGLRRSDPVERLTLRHGDCLVFGGADRLRHHGIAPVKAGHHPLTGDIRFNLTFRRAAPL